MPPGLCHPSVGQVLAPALLTVGRKVINPLSYHNNEHLLPASNFRAHPGRATSLIPAACMGISIFLSPKISCTPKNPPSPEASQAVPELLVLSPTAPCSSQHPVDALHGMLPLGTCGVPCGLPKPRGAPGQQTALGLQVRAASEAKPVKISTPAANSTTGGGTGSSALPGENLGF